ncbi:MAG TPA: ABC transporter ATP-binding protein [Mycobacteriales bacterium]|nr:ABC transporter ATP-binding protein [Mycobacteriales bacterium]
MSPTKPDLAAPATEADRHELLRVDDLHVHFALRGGLLQRFTGRSSGAVKAVDGVSFALRRGEVLGVVGESGSGKTTLGRAILRTIPITGGRVRFEGVDITDLRESQLRPLRQRMQMVFQDPNASLNPAMDLLTAVGHPLRIHGITDDEDQIRRRVAQAFETVGLAPVDQFLHKYPSDLSGGQKQRAVIARAIILNPRLLVADEPVSMLDMSVRAKILQLMLELKQEMNLTYVYVTHDLATAKFFCDTIAIMYLGRIVEYGPAEEIYADPKHPYTQSLLRAVPEPDPAKSVPRDLPRGEVPDAARPPLGCSFHPRCPKAFEICGWESRDLRDLLERHWLAHPDDGLDQSRRVVGDVSALDQPALTATVPTGGGHSSGEVAELLDRIKADDPDEPLWSGVRDVRRSSGGVDVEFRDDCVDPPLYRVDQQDVACLLYRDNPVTR